MALFGIGTNLTMLYAARILGGMLSSAVLPAASAYIADVTSEQERGQGMARLGSAVGLGVVIGPGLGALLSRLDWHLSFQYAHLSIDDFSTPFFAAALLSLLTLIAAVRWLPESWQPESAKSQSRQSSTLQPFSSKSFWPLTQSSLGRLLGLSLLSQFALALFEGTFALHAQRVMNYGPTQMGAVFMVCGLVMGVLQAGPIGWLINRRGEENLLPAGFGLVGVSLIMLMTTQGIVMILIYVALLALGMALISPSLTVLVTKRAGRQAGTALGFQTAANSLGQAGGPFVGGLLFVWHVHAPYVLTAFFVILIATMLGWKGWRDFRAS